MSEHGDIMDAVDEIIRETNAAHELQYVPVQTPADVERARVQHHVALDVQNVSRAFQNFDDILAQMQDRAILDALHGELAAILQWADRLERTARLKKDAGQS